MKHLNDIWYLQWRYIFFIPFFIPGNLITSQWSSSTWSDNSTVDAALGQTVVHVSEPPQTDTSTLSFTAAGPDSSMIFVRLSPATSVGAAANQFVLRSGTAIISQTTDLTRLATVLILAVLPIVEWLSSVRVFSDIISTWASNGTIGVRSEINTGHVGVCDSFNSVFTVCTWTIVSDSFDVEP
jgi:hypothetical protein